MAPPNVPTNTMIIVTTNKMTITVHIMTNAPKAKVAITKAINVIGTEIGQKKSQSITQKRILLYSIMRFPKSTILVHHNLSVPYIEVVNRIAPTKRRSCSVIICMIYST